MATGWYYTRSGNKYGPLTDEELRRAAVDGKLTPNDLIWKAGMQQWAPAKRLKGLFLEQSGGVPPSPASRESQPAAARKPVVRAGQAVSAVRGGDSSRGGFWAHAVQGGKFAPALGAFFGFVADFLQPLAPINAYLFGVTVIATLILVGLWLKTPQATRHQWDKPMPNQSLIFCGFLMCAFGFWFLLERIGNGQEKGVVAGKIPAIADLQASLLNIRQDIAAVKEDTQAILGETKKIGAHVDDLGKLGGLIKDPQTPGDYYHNARVHELGGNFGQAFNSYEQYLNFNQDFVDPIESYLLLLEQQRGHAAAVQSFASLRKTFPSNTALELVACKLLSDGDKESALNQFVERNPRCGPAYIALADLFSAEQAPNRSAVQGDMEQKNLREAIRLGEQGEFVRWYLDKRHADVILARAKERVTQSANTGIVDANEFIQFLGGGIRVMDRQVTTIYYSYDRSNWKEATNFRIEGGLFKWAEASIDRAGYTAKLQTARSLPDKTGHFIYVKYRDTTNHESRIYEIDFVARAQEWEKKMQRLTGDSKAELEKAVKGMNEARGRYDVNTTEFEAINRDLGSADEAKRTDAVRRLQEYMQKKQDRP